MVGTHGDVNGYRLGAHVVEEPPCVPRVQVPVWEDDVRVVFEVQLGVPAAKEIWGPIVPGGQVKVLLAVLGVPLIGPRVWEEHIGHPILPDRHGHFIASQETPPRGIKTPLRLVSNLVAGGHLPSVIVVNLHSLIEGPHVVHIARDGLTQGGLTWSIYWPGGHWENERSLVGVVDHSHGTQSISHRFNDQLNDHCGVYFIANVEYLLNSRVLILVVPVLVEPFQPLLNVHRAGLIHICETLCGDLIVSVWGNLTLKEHNWSTTGKSSLEGLGVLHPQPSSKHATVWTPRNNHSKLSSTGVLLSNVSD